MRQHNDMNNYEEYGIGLSITKTAMIYAITLPKSTKSASSGKIPTEIINIMSENKL